jgi:hypothetical protein
MAQRTENVKPVQGLKDDDIVTIYRNLAAARSDTQAKAGECGAILKQFESLGGNRKALSLYYSLEKMGEEKRDDFLRSLLNILRVMGVSVAPDMVDLMESAPAEEPAKPAKAPRASKAVQSRVSRIKAKAVAKEADKAANDLAKPVGGFAGMAH